MDIKESLDKLQKSIIDINTDMDEISKVIDDVSIYESDIDTAEIRCPKCTRPSVANAVRDMINAHLNRMDIPLKNYRVYHFDDGLLTIVVLRDSLKVKIGFAFQSPSEEPNPLEGELLALNRIMHVDKDTTYAIQYDNVEWLDSVCYAIQAFCTYQKKLPHHYKNVDFGFSQQI